MSPGGRTEDEPRLAREARSEQLRLRIYKDDVQRVMGTASGRNVIAGLLELLKVSGSLMTGNSHTFYNVAKLDAERAIREMLMNVDLSAYQLMEREERGRQVKEDESDG